MNMDFWDFIKKYSLTLIAVVLGSLFLGVGFIPFLTPYESGGMYWLIIYAVIVGAIVAYNVAEDSEGDRIRNIQSEATKTSTELQSQINELTNQNAQLDLERQKAEEEQGIWRQSLLERTSGFPSINEMISAYEEARDDYLAGYLKDKRNPALKAAEAVKEETRKRREFESLYRQTKALNELYEKVAPFLTEYKDEFIGEEEEYAYENYTEEERQDAVTNYLPPEEYRKLPAGVRNQKALDRYWTRNHRNAEIGKMYERYVGYLYENQGYDVEYIGIEKEKGDLGRDLVCVKGKEHIVIQCKFWSQFKTIHEKHIFYLFGTVFQYRLQHKGQKIRALFYTTTQISDLAKAFAKELDIEIKEGFPMDKKYPCIKCNIGVKGEKIYHLPFDQQYDNTNIEIKKGEFYCATVKDAEKAGFRRAYRWRGAAKV